MRTVQVINQTRGETVCDRVEVANTSMRRLFGLLGRRGLGPGEGLWIKPSSGVHTVGMMFAIDVVGLDRQGVVVKLWRNLVPFRVTAVSMKMQSVIELRAGQIEASRIELGDRLELVEQVDARTVVPALRRGVSMESGRRPERDSQIAVAMLLMFAAAFRVMLLYSVARSQSLEWFYRRGREMAFLAVSILGGHGLSSPFGGHTGASAMIGPAFPLVVAAIFHVFGPYSFAAEVAAMSFQAAVSVLNVWLILRLGTLLGGRKVGWVAAVVWAFSPAIAGMVTVFWDTSITTTAMLAMVLLAALWREKRSLPIAAAMGGCCGLAALVNPALLTLAAAIALWQAWQSAGQRMLRSALSMAALVAVFAIWPVRNAVELHAFVPMRTTPGIDLWLGNHEGSTGYFPERLLPMFDAGEMSALTRLGEVGYDQYKRAQFAAYVRERPMVFAGLTLRRVVRFWTGRGDFDRPLIYQVQAIPTLLLGVVGLVWLGRRRRSLAVLPALPMAVFPLPYYVTHADFRYRSEIDPLMTVLAACAVVWLAEVAAARRAERLKADLPVVGLSNGVGAGWAVMQGGKGRELS